MTGEWWVQLPGETEQEWANRIEENNPSEEDEVRLANMRARHAKRLAQGVLDFGEAVS